MAAAMAAPTLFPPLTTWDGSFSLDQVDFPFTMVGTDPAAGSQTTTVSTVIIPLIFKFGTKTASPKKKNVCYNNQSPLTLVLNSPIFQNFDYQPGGTDVGDTQYTDAFQRANFWSTVSGSAPDYHVLLGTPTVAAPVTITVSKKHGVFQGTTGCGPVGVVDIAWFDGVKVPQLLKNKKIKPNVLPIFLAYNVFFYEGFPANCCILGYHNAVLTSKGVQTYSEAAFSDVGIFQGDIEDTEALGHEVAEWLDDPFVNNLTPPWGHIGQVSGCQNNLEDGDPLTGTVFDVPLGGFTYHQQDLAFVSWFAQAQTSFGVNGWFSFMGNFLTSASLCS
jgi:hypothetical protein